MFHHLSFPIQVVSDRFTYASLSLFENVIIQLMSFFSEALAFLERGDY